jgi:DNA-binding transcriptional ArsR family regulator
MVDNETPVEEKQKSLLLSIKELSAILNAISNPNRLKILVFLITGSQTFQVLLDETKLKKSALANHLTVLRNSFLIEKVHHGTYKITSDGKRYLYAMDEIYEQSETSKNSQQRYQMVKSFLERNKVH